MVRAQGSHGSSYVATPGRDGLRISATIDFENPVIGRSYGSFALESLSETKSKISLDCVSEADAGLYECVAQTNSKKTSVATEVHVVSK